MSEVMYRAWVTPTFCDPAEYWFDEYPVLKHTKCGVWVDVFGMRKFINTQSRKQYAYATKDEAVVGYIKRTERYIKILQAKLDRAQDELSIAKGIKPQVTLLLCDLSVVQR